MQQGLPIEDPLGAEDARPLHERPDPFFAYDPRPDARALHVGLPEVHLVAEDGVRHDPRLQQQSGRQHQALKAASHASGNDLRRPSAQSVLRHQRRQSRLHQGIGRAKDTALQERLDRAPGEKPIPQAQEALLLGDAAHDAEVARVRRLLGDLQELQGVAQKRLKQPSDHSGDQKLACKEGKTAEKQRRRNRASEETPCHAVAERLDFALDASGKKRGKRRRKMGKFWREKGAKIPHLRQKLHVLPCAAVEASRSHLGEHRIDGAVLRHQGSGCNAAGAGVDALLCRNVEHHSRRSASWERHYRERDT
eukprot:scaffold3581_cov252-Pinguiococcus_pyrenoidosus.AAC.28